MNRSRIVIPTTTPDPPAPHFDDEATVVSARQVVPIAKAWVVERKTAALWISLILLSSAACGALGAIGVNYFEHGRPGSLVAAPQNEMVRPQNTRVANPNASDSISQSETAAGGPTVSPSPQPVTDQRANANQSNNSPPIVLSEVSLDQTTGNQAASASNIASEPGRLVRKRRVHLLTRNEGPSPRTKRGKIDKGAGRIQEIFDGRGPP